MTLGLEAVLGGGAGDAQVDNVIVNGTSSRDVIGIVASGGTAVVNGPPCRCGSIVRRAPTTSSPSTASAGDGFSIGSGLPSLIGVTVNQ